MTTKGIGSKLKLKSKKIQSDLDQCCKIFRDTLLSENIKPLGNDKRTTTFDINFYFHSGLKESLNVRNFRTKTFQRRSEGAKIVWPPEKNA